MQNTNTKIVLVAGTNGKTTTSLMLKSILKESGKSVLHNASGANLRNGIASYLLLNTNRSGKITQDFAIFESDENTLPHLLNDISPTFLVVLNLFRDQLDRYGELTLISTTLILNADDPLVASLGKNSKAQKLFFGITVDYESNITDFAVDSVQCYVCGEKLLYTKTFFSHLGIWHCPGCKLERPKPSLEEFRHYPLDGMYNKYNTHAAVLTAQKLSVDTQTIINAFKEFEPAFGRQEVIRYNGKRIQIFLSKNPTGFNESLKTICDKNAKHVMLLLNDRIPDGKDVSWIWDVGFEDTIQNFPHITVSGDRVYDLTLRLKYAEEDDISFFESLKNALSNAVSKLSKDETLYILATYSAMLEARKLLTGKKIL